jgi:hypothetical protein
MDGAFASVRYPAGGNRAGKAARVIRADEAKRRASFGWTNDRG